MPWCRDDFGLKDRILTLLSIATVAKGMQTERSFTQRKQQK
jgi:hypothetical protein